MRFLILSLSSIAVAAFAAVLFVEWRAEPESEALVGSIAGASRSPAPFHTPRFTDFPVPLAQRSFDTVAENIDFSTVSDPSVPRTLLETGYAEGPNFAGTYTVVSWGCGNRCHLSAIIDTKDGSIVEYGILSQAGLSFQRESTLLAVNPREILEALPTVPPELSSDYYVFEDGALRHILKIDRNGVYQRQCPELPVTATHPITGQVREFATLCKVPTGWVLPR